MWTFQRVKDEFSEDHLRRLTVEVNNLICGYSDGEVNRTGQPQELWVKLLAHGHVTEAGIQRALEGNRVTQRDTEGAFIPYTVQTIFNLTDGDDALLSAEEADGLIEKILRFQGVIED